MSEQEFSVHDKNHASLPATEEGQDVSSLPPIVVPPPSYTDPNNPAAAGGSVNFDLDSHPLELSEDYGLSVGDYRTAVMGTMDDPSEGGHPDPGGEDAKVNAAKGADLPEDREEWTKAHYQTALRAAGLPTSGKIDALADRYSEYEAQEEEYKAYNAGNWIDDVEGAETQDDLDEVKAAYGRSGAEFATVAKAIEKKQSEFDNPEK